MKFLNKGGTHEDEKGVRYPTGSVITADKPLDTLFPCKYERVLDHAVSRQTLTESTVEVDAEVEPEIEGEDVTSRFDTASENDLTVMYYKGKGFKVLNQGKEISPEIKTIKKLNVFLAQYVENEGGNAGADD